MYGWFVLNHFSWDLSIDSQSVVYNALFETGDSHFVILRDLIEVGGGVQSFQIFLYPLFFFFFFFFFYLFFLFLFFEKKKNP